MDRLSSLAVESAAALAKNLGLSTDTPVVLKDGSNVIVHLAPAPVVARVATSTALVRPDVSQWLARELAVARFLEQQGAPAVTPSHEIDPGPHVYDGYAISYWSYVEHDRNKTLSVRDAAPLLRESACCPCQLSGRAAISRAGDRRDTSLAEIPGQKPRTHFYRYDDASRSPMEVG